MPINWESCKTKGLKHSSRWGHSSSVLKYNEMVLFGGYAGIFFILFEVESKYMNDIWIYDSKINEWNETEV